MSTKRIFLILVLVGLFIIALAAVAKVTFLEPVPTKEPLTFEECAQMYPVMESYPRQCRTDSGILFVEQIAPTEEPETPTQNETAEIPNLIRVDTPTRGAEISSPVTITGSARGMWYFEASFPIEIRNADGVVIGGGIGEAQSEWMTENYVDFRATISFPVQPEGSQGSIVLKKDNPSGDPERDQELVIPIVF